MVGPRQADASDALITRTYAREEGEQVLSIGPKEGRNHINKEERKIKIFHHFKEISQASIEGL